VSRGAKRGVFEHGEGYRALHSEEKLGGACKGGGVYWEKEQPEKKFSLKYGRQHLENPMG